MSLISKMLEKINKQVPIRVLISDPSISSIDPITNGNLCSDKEFQKKIDKKSKKTEAGKLIITLDQLEALKAAYKDAPSSIVPGTPNYMKVMALLNVFDLNSVKKIALANIPTLSKLAKELIGDKKESELLKTGLDTDMHDHDHEFYLGDDRTQAGGGDGHDHAMIYHNGKPTGTGPAPDDGHIHEV